jgi:hypothetical protein
MNQRVPSPASISSIPSDHPLTHDKLNGFCSPKSTKRVGRGAWCCAPARAARATITGWAPALQKQDFRAEGCARAEQETEEKKPVRDQIGDQDKQTIQ